MGRISLILKLERQLKKIDLTPPSVICVTGQIAAGKNYVSSLLENSGCVSVDLDKIAHAALDELSGEIFRAFEKTAAEKKIMLKNDDGSLNRRNLGKLIFESPELLKAHENIVYPKVVELTERFIEQNKEKTVVLNAAVLFKTPELLRHCRFIVFVRANAVKRFFRCKSRDKMPVRQIFARFFSQRNLLRNYKKSGIPVVFIRN